MNAVANFPLGAENVSALIATPSNLLRQQVLERIDGRWERVHHVPGGADALARLEDGDWQVLFLDRHLPDLDCVELVGIIQRPFSRSSNCDA